VSKRLGSRYRSGRSPDWLKMKNPAAPAGEARGRRRLGAVRAFRVHGCGLLHTSYDFGQLGE